MLGEIIPVIDAIRANKNLKEKIEIKMLMYLKKLEK